MNLLQQCASLTSCALLLAGCATKHLVYVHETDLGIALSASTEGNPAELTIGFDRETFSMIPQYSNGSSSSSTDSSTQTMSVMAVHRFESTGLNEVHFQNAFASGDAAVETSQNATLFTDMVRRIGSPQTPKTPTGNGTTTTETGDTTTTTNNES